MRVSRLTVLLCAGARRKALLGASARSSTTAAVIDWFDRWLVGGAAVRGTASVTHLVGQALRLVQTGSLQTYAFLLVLGVALILFVILGT